MIVYYLNTFIPKFFNSLIKGMSTAVKRCFTIPEPTFQGVDLRPKAWVNSFCSFIHIYL